MRWNTGSRKASVLPLPVLAMAMRSSPAHATGHARCWISLGASKPAAASAARVSAANGASENARHAGGAGAGASAPAAAAAPGASRRCFLEGEDARASRSRLDFFSFFSFFDFFDFFDFFSEESPIAVDGRARGAPSAGGCDEEGSRRIERRHDAKTR